MNKEQAPSREACWFFARCASEKKQSERSVERSRIEQQVFTLLRPQQRSHWDSTKCGESQSVESRCLERIVITISLDYLILKYLFCFGVESKFDVVRLSLTLLHSLNNTQDQLRHRPRLILKPSKEQIVKRRKLIKSEHNVGL
jgi:hypothetical protein